MEMVDIENIEGSVELPVGTKFYFFDHLYEVTELDGEDWGCSKCALLKEDLCGVMNCRRRTRRDKKCIFFKEVETV